MNSSNLNTAGTVRKFALPLTDVMGEQGGSGGHDGAEGVPAVIDGVLVTGESPPSHTIGHQDERSGAIDCGGALACGDKMDADQATSAA